MVIKGAIPIDLTIEDNYNPSSTHRECDINGLHSSRHISGAGTLVNHLKRSEPAVISNHLYVFINLRC